MIRTFSRYAAPTPPTDAEALRWLRAALEGAELALWEVDLAAPRGRIACSPVFAALLGADPDATPAGALLCQPIPLAVCRARIHPDDLPAVQAALRAAAAATEVLPPGQVEGPPFRLACRLRPPDGDHPALADPAGVADRGEVSIEARGRFHRDGASGRATHCRGVAFDVTARRRAEAARDREIAVRRAFAEGSPDALWVADAATGRLEAASPAFEAVLGAPPARVLAQHRFPWPELVHPADRPLLTGRLRAVADGAVGEIEYRILQHDPGADEHWVRCTAFPLGSHRPAQRIGGILRDITAAKATARALAESEARLRLAQEAAQIGVYERDLLAGRARWSPAMFQVWGLDPAGRSPSLSDDEYTALILPEDRERHRARRAAMRDDPGVSRFASEYRIRRADTGEVRWIASRGEYVRDAGGRAVLVRGTNHDVTDRKRTEERQTLLMREVDHRAKNALAVVQAVLRLTPRDDAQAYARAVEGRIAALARVQTLLSEERWSGADLRAVLAGEVAPFRSAGQRVSLDGPPVELPPGVVQPLAMAAHELATNALKHGALSLPAGRVCLTWRLAGPAQEELRLRWAETAGPLVPEPPRQRGFGTRVLDSTVRRQLGGTVSLDWRSTGLICDITLPLRKTAAFEP